MYDPGNNENIYDRANENTDADTSGGAVNNTEETPDARGQAYGTESGGSGEYHYVRPDYGRETGYQSGSSSYGGSDYSGSGYQSGSGYGSSYQSGSGSPDYTEANYTPVGDGTPRTPRYYYTSPEEHKKTKVKKAKKSGGVTTAKLIAVCLVCAILGGTLGAGGVSLLSDRLDSSEQTSDSAPVEDDSADSAVTDTDTGTAADDGSTATEKTPTTTVSSSSGSTLTASEIYDLACTQVVGVTTEVTTSSIFGGTSTSSVSGTGFVVSEDGYLVTNYHVIETAYEGGYDVTVMFYNGDSYTAEIVGFEEDNDIAVLKIDASGLNPVTFADSDEIVVGSTVYAVGNPLGELIYTMTTGSVSALNREITFTDSTTSEKNTINMFQIDAAVNSGNSGGPVYNDQGQVIGVVTAKYSSTGVEGIGFAIPSNDASFIANELIENGYVSGKAYMGISVNTVTENIAEYYNMVVGACVIAVDEDSCAATAGLKIGDIITAIDDTTITTGAELAAAKKNYKAGDTATLTVYRSGEELQLTITFDEEEPTESTSSGADNNTGSGSDSNSGYFGNPNGSW